MDYVPEIITAVVASFTVFSGLIVWVVKYAVRKSDKHLERLIGLLETSVNKFAAFEREEEVTHMSLTASQSTILETQRQIVINVQHLVENIQKMTDRIDTQHRELLNRIGDSNRG